MPNPLFDGLADVFVETLGEPVTYSPLAGQARTIQAIWKETTQVVALGDRAPVDVGTTTLSIRAEDGTPAEGDRVRRLSDGKVMEVTTPILPDGKGMVRCNLADVEIDDLGLVFSSPVNSGYLALLEDI